jgi:hypothetical protein
VRLGVYSLRAIRPRWICSRKLPMRFRETVWAGLAVAEFRSGGVTTAPSSQAQAQSTRSFVLALLLLFAGCSRPWASTA